MFSNWGLSYTSWLRPNEGIPPMVGFGSLQSSWQLECEEMRAEVLAFEARLDEEDQRLSDAEPELIFGEMED